MMQKRADRKCKRTDVFALLCGACVLLFLLWDLFKMLALPNTEIIASYVIMAQCLLAGLMIAKGALWHYKWWLSLALGLGWMLISVLLQMNTYTLEEAVIPLQRGVWAFFICAPLGCLLNKKQIKRFLQIFAAVWTACYAVFSGAGVYAALYDTAIYNYNGTLAVRIDPELRRLTLFHYPTVTSSYLCIAVLIALMGWALHKQKAVKALYAVACLPMLICLSLTDGRGAFVSLGAAVGLILAIPVFDRLLKKWNIKAVLAVCCVVVVIVTAASYVLMPKLLTAFNSAKEQIRSGNGWLQSAMAEEAEFMEETQDTEAVDAAHRTQSSLGFLSGRQYVWKAAVDLMLDQPILLLTGTSPTRVLQYLAPYLIGAPMQGYMHTHNLFLQVLVEGGVIALTLLVWFLVSFVKAAFRLLLDPNRCMWERILPVPAAAVLIGELVDYITQLSAGLQVTPILMLFMGFTLVLGQKKKENQA